MAKEIRLDSYDIKSKQKEVGLNSKISENKHETTLDTHQTTLNNTPRKIIYWSAYQKMKLPNKKEWCTDSSHIKYVFTQSFLHE